MYSFFFKELIFVFKQKICILDLLVSEHKMYSFFFKELIFVFKQNLLVSESRRLSHFCHTFILKSKYLMMNSLIGSF